MANGKTLSGEISKTPVSSFFAKKECENVKKHFGSVRHDESEMHD